MKDLIHLQMLLLALITLSGCHPSDQSGLNFSSVDADEYEKAVYHKVEVNLYGHPNTSEWNETQLNYQLLGITPESLVITSESLSDHQPVQASNEN